MSALRHLHPTGSGDGRRRCDRELELANPAEAGRELQEGLWQRVAAARDGGSDDTGLGDASCKTPAGREEQEGLRRRVATARDGRRGGDQGPLMNPKSKMFI
jgi:hypothetical protein